jgi:hypothetical protein
MLDRFIPSLPRSTRAAAGALPAPGRLGDAPVDRQFLQDQAADAVIGIQRDLLQPGEDPGLDPLVAPFPDGGGTTGAVGDRLRRTAEPQDLDQFFEDDPVTDPRPVTAQRVSGIINRPVGQQRGELVPQRFQQP